MGTGVTSGNCSRSLFKASTGFSSLLAPGFDKAFDAALAPFLAFFFTRGFEAPSELTDELRGLFSRTSLVTIVVAFLGITSCELDAAWDEAGASRNRVSLG